MHRWNHRVYGYMVHEQAQNKGQTNEPDDLRLARFPSTPPARCISLHVR